jgi:dihydrolipoamide dehydrogenase
MTRECDVLVIGAGPGGYVAAIRAGRLGKKVMLIEREKLGGECLNWGCIPSKALIHAGNIFHKVESGSEWGLNVMDVSLDMKKLQAWKQKVVDKLTSGVGQLCRGNKVEILAGSATFLSEYEADVSTTAGKEIVSFKNCIIATGGRPSDLPGLAFDGKRIISSKEALELTKVPDYLIVVGGGAIGLELGTFYAKLKSKVTVIEIMDQILPGTDPEAVRIVSRKLAKFGVEVHTGSTIKSWRHESGKIMAKAETPQGLIDVVGDFLLLTVGRKANTDGLGLDNTKVALDKKGQVIVDKQMRTSVPHIFAVGDVTGPPFLAHRASKQGIVAAEVCAGMKSEADFKAIPAAVFTDPELAVVGMGEKEAVEKGLKPKVGKVGFAALGRPLAAGEGEGFVKIITEEKSGLVLGAVIVGPKASDLISELAFAIEMSATAEDLAYTMHPHPTFPEAIMETAEAALGKAIHILNR